MKNTNEKGSRVKNIKKQTQRTQTQEEYKVKDSIVKNIKKQSQTQRTHTMNNIKKKTVQ